MWYIFLLNYLIITVHFLTVPRDVDSTRNSITEKNKRQVSIQTSAFIESGLDRFTFRCRYNGICCIHSWKSLHYR